MLIHHFLTESAQRHPEKEAVWYNGDWMTYGAIEERSSKLALSLIEAGVHRGDRVALLYENSFNYLVAYYAILKADGVVVGINAESTSSGILYILNHSGAVALIASSKYFRSLVPIKKDISQLRAVITDHPFPVQPCELKMECMLLDEIYSRRETTLPGNKNIDIDMSAIVYTSGSTGEPKGVMLSHLNTVSNTQSIVSYLEITNRDRILALLPFYYVYGNTLFNTHFMAGGSVVIDNRFTYPNVVLQTMMEQKVTGFAGVPSTFMILLNKSILRESKFPDLRYVTQAGGNMAPAIQKQVHDMFLPAKTYIMYGATELSPRQCFVPPEMLEKKYGSIGISVPNSETFIADEQGNRLTPGLTGEVAARGSNVMMGYWRDPEGTAKVLRNGNYFTGDLGYMDEDGYIFLTGRSSDMLKVGGNRVSAKEIEDALLAIAGIQEAAVIGVEDSILGEAAKAFLVSECNGVITEETVKQLLLMKLAAYKIPKYFEFRDSLPKNTAGKIMKIALKKE
jgi:acyl-CoA synthetase (AMP-forming)/AMP-acid ligase II